MLWRWWQHIFNSCQFLNRNSSAETKTCKNPRNWREFRQNSNFNIKTFSEKENSIHYWLIYFVFGEMDFIQNATLKSKDSSRFDVSYAQPLMYLSNFTVSYAISSSSTFEYPKCRHIITFQVFISGSFD
jgi:hypothetical protein